MLSSDSCEERTMGSGIEWTTETWNPVVGCSRVSEGCIHCYAEQMAGRLKQMGVDQYQDVVHQPEGVDEWRWTGDVEYAEHRLSLPLEWDEPRRVFVDSMSDLFHPDVDFEYIAAVWGVMADCPEHTFQVLTKRPERARDFFRWVKSEAKSEAVEQYLPGTSELTFVADCTLWREGMGGEVTPGDEWPLPNVWLGVSAEDQDAADERIPPLLECPAAMRFVSAEPLLEEIDFGEHFARVSNEDLGLSHDPLAAAQLRQGVAEGWAAVSSTPIDWVIVGGESGPNARPCDIDWIRSIRDQCESAGVPCFIKQLGARPAMNEVDADDGSEQLVPVDPDGWGEWLDDPKGGDSSEWPEHLQVRQFPEEVAGA